MEGFGAFAGWQTAALKAYRKSLLLPWPWGACWGSGLGPGPGPWPWGACWGSCLGPRVHVGEGVWNFGSLDPLQALKASRKSLLWIWGACWGRCLEGLAGFGGFGAFGEFWRVCGLESFGGFAGWQTAALKASRKSLLWI